MEQEERRAIDIVFLDIETTGLSPQHDDILEIGLITVDKYFNVMERVSFVNAGADTSKVRDAFVFEMHQSSGLLRYIEMRGVELMEADTPDYTPSSLCGVDRGVVTWLREQGLKSKIVPAGFSVHFDCGFIKAQMPLLASMLSHRVLDVSSVSRALSCVGWTAPDARRVHRALPDCDDALSQLTYFFTLFQKPLPPESV